MEIRIVDFFLGFLLGGGLGFGLTLGIARLRKWLGYSEAGRLASENRELKRRLAEKDRYIGRMLTETERLAEKLGRGNTLLKESPEMLTNESLLRLTQEE